MLTRAFIWTLSLVVVLECLLQLLSEEPQLLSAKVHISSDALAQLCSMPQRPSLGMLWSLLHLNSQ